MEIINLHLLLEFERIKKELKEKGHIVKDVPLLEEEQMFAHLIAVYDATKNLIGG